MVKNCEICNRRRGVMCSSIHGCLKYSDYVSRKNPDDEEIRKVHRSIIDAEPAIEWWGNLHYTIGLKYMNKHRGNAPSEFDGITEGNFGFIKYVWEQETQEKHGKISG